MRISALYALSALLTLALQCPTAHADVGDCSILFAYSLRTPLTAQQQEEIGKRLWDAHVASPQSDGHIVFICRIDTSDTDLRGKLYRISETEVEGAFGYILSAPSLEGLRLALHEVEHAFKENHVYALKSGAREKVLSSPLLEEREYK